MGGCLQCFVRRGAKFETGMHFIGSAREGQTLRRLLRFLGIDDISLSELDTKAYDIVRLGSDEFRFPTGGDAFVEQMCSYFPHEAKGIEAYWRCVERVANASSLHTLSPENADSAVSAEYQMRSIDEVIGSLVKDPLLRNVLVGNLPLYAARRGRTPFSTHAFIVDFYNQSSFRVVGGSDTIGFALQRELERYGGRVLTNAKVVRIHSDANHVTGVSTADERFFAADTVVSAIHPAATLTMTDSPLIRPAFRQRIASLPNTVGIFSVYLDFKEDTMPYLNSNYYAYRNGISPWDCEDYTPDDWPLGYLYMHFCHENQPRYARAGVILSYMRFDEMAPWLGTTVGHRGEDYERFFNNGYYNFATDLRVAARDSMYSKYYQKACELNTVEAYQDYINHFAADKDAKFVYDAQSRIDKILNPEPEVVEVERPHTQTTTRRHTTHSGSDKKKPDHVKKDDKKKEEKKKEEKNTSEKVGGMLHGGGKKK